jgi:energy-coupling factor transporter ATP-binding protein EcfA2
VTRQAADSRDPFHESTRMGATRRLQILGARIDFESNSRALLRLVDAAYAGLPRHRLSPTPRLRVRLMLTEPGTKHGDGPPEIGMLGGSRLLGGATASSTLAILSPREGTALIVVSGDMLRHPYHVRYELIEFAVCTLAARAQRLVPLHAACVGRAGRGILLMGRSGAGKSTVALHCLLRGMEFVAEDGVFVTADSLLATGAANFLHVRSDSLGWLDGTREAALIRNSPVITRRSGVEKFEVDLRRPRWALSASPPKIGAVVFLSSQSAGGGPLLRRMAPAELLAKLKSNQAYAAQQPQWRTFARNVARGEAFVLRRGRHPDDAVDALEGWLGSRQAAVRRA